MTVDNNNIKSNIIFWIQQSMMSSCSGRWTFARRLLWWTFFLWAWLIQSCILSVLGLRSSYSRNEGSSLKYKLLFISPKGKSSYLIKNIENLRNTNFYLWWNKWKFIFERWTFVSRIWTSKTQNTEDTWLNQPCSEEKCPTKKLTSKCSTSRTRTNHTLLNSKYYIWFYIIIVNCHLEYCINKIYFNLCYLSGPASFTNFFKLCFIFYI